MAENINTLPFSPFKIWHDINDSPFYITLLCPHHHPKKEMEFGNIGLETTFWVTQSSSFYRQPLNLFRKVIRCHPKASEVIYPITPIVRLFWNLSFLMVGNFLLICNLNVFIPHISTCVLTIISLNLNNILLYFWRVSLTNAFLDNWICSFVPHKSILLVSPWNTSFLFLSSS